MKPGKEADAQVTASAKMKKQSFVLDVGKEDRIIRGDLYAGCAAASDLVILHGFKGSKIGASSPMPRSSANRGFAVITFNFSIDVGKISSTLRSWTSLQVSKAGQRMWPKSSGNQSGAPAREEVLDRTGWG